jgi:serralysin
MSYVDTFDAYYTNGETAAADWGATADGGPRETSYTPMALDILAAQQLYGASAQAASPTGAYRGGQVFGFNCNIKDASKVFFDFTTDAAPIVTLFDYGLNNTLDLSGYGATISNVVNLNQGAFSSVGGLTNNVCIAYGAHIETAIGGLGDDTFYVNADADHIVGGGGTNTVVFSGLRANYTISYTSSGVVVTDTSTSAPVAYGLSGIQTAQFAGGQIEALCFLKGTRIRTPEGEVAVEALRPGDLMLTAQGDAKPMVWLGRMTVAARFANPLRSYPIRIRAGALGENLPHSDLLVSPAHALLIEDVLINAGALVNGTSIVRETAVPEVFVYYHVELDDHALILAEGVAAETFIDDVDRVNFDNWAEHQAVFPDGKPVNAMPMPRAKSRRQIPQHIRAALDRRAEELGMAVAAAA